MNLNKEFKQAIIDNQYYYSAFDGKMHDINDLQVCHILSKSKRTLNSIKKAYGCSEKTADILVNMPLLNTVIGTRKDNAEYKKTDDIVYIDKRLLIVLSNLYFDTIKELGGGDGIAGLSCHIHRLFRFVLLNCNGGTLFSDFVYEHYLSRDLLKNVNTCIITGLIKDIQYKFHKEIDLHI